MSYQQRLESALALVSEHNSAVGQGNPGCVDGEKFVANLKALGATSENDLNDLTWEQVLKCLNLAIATPAAIEPQKLAQKCCAVGVFRDEKAAEVTPVPGTVVVSDKKAAKMTLRQLVENFDPEEPDNAVGKRLASIAKGRPFIVYKEGRTVHVDATFAQIAALKQGHPPMDVAMVEGLPVRVYCLGELPENKAEENPLYPGRPLRPDGTCDQTLRSYNGVPKEVRQLLKFACLTGARKGGLDINNVGDANNWIDVAVGTEPMKKLRERFAKIVPAFEKAVKDGDKEMRLEVDLVGPKQIVAEAGRPSNRPFDSGTKVQWTRVTGGYADVRQVRADLLCRRNFDPQGRSLDERGQ